MTDTTNNDVTNDDTTNDDVTMDEVADTESAEAASPGATGGSTHAAGVGYLEGRGYTVGSFVMAVLAFVVIPPLHGVIGAVLGYIGHRKGDPLGRTAMVCSLVAMVVGSVVAALAFSSAT